MLLSLAEKRRILRIHERKALLRSRGLQYRDFGDPSLVKRVIHEEQPNLRLRRLIAKRLRLPYHALWTR